MVTARFLGNKFVKPIIEKHKAKGRAQGLAVGRAVERRRMDAAASRAPFNEPPPGS